MHTTNRTTKATRVIMAICILAVVVAVAWSMGALAGWPALPLSDNTGTQRTFSVDEARALVAITNAFDRFKYNQMMLSDAAGEGWLAAGWHPTNGFLLVPTLEPIARVPTKGILGYRHLQYLAWFHITTSPTGTNQTTINVRTVLAKVVDGISLDPHGGGRGTTKVSPVRREEERVLAAISEQLSNRNEPN